MRIISWNVNGLRAVHKKGALDWLFKEGPDIICLQETKATPDQLSQELISPTGYISYFNYPDKKKGYSGVALYTKIKPKEVFYGMDKKKDEEGRIIAAEYEDLYLFNVYFPNGGGGPERLSYKLAFYEKFLKDIEKFKRTKPIIFCGDINTAHTEIDLARPKENEKNTGFLAEERAWIDKVLSKGYKDIFRLLHKGQKDAYTYWDMKSYARDRNVGWRIDYFFVSSELVKSIKSTAILGHILGSDHCPIELVLS